MNQAFLENLDDSYSLPIFEESRHTALSQLFDNELNFELWEPFSNCTEEQQNEMLQTMLNNLDQLEAQGDQSQRHQQQPMWSREELEELVRKAFKDVERMKDRLLGNSEFLEELEKEIVRYINCDCEEGRQCATALFFSSDYFEGLIALNPPPSTAKFTFHNSFHRLLAHGLCRYYSLNSHSENSKGKRVTVVNKPKSGVSLPPVSLSTYLTEVTC